jgi:hypothetical protein
MPFLPAGTATGTENVALPVKGSLWKLFKADRLKPATPVNCAGDKAGPGAAAPCKAALPALGLAAEAEDELLEELLEEELLLEAVVEEVEVLLLEAVLAGALLA